MFIDFGYCFHAGEWRFEDAPLRGRLLPQRCVPGDTGWESFEPWLTRLETMPAETVWAAANEVPPEWYGGDLSEMEALVEKLLARRSRIRELIEAFREVGSEAVSEMGRVGEKGRKRLGRVADGGYDEGELRGRDSY